MCDCVRLINDHLLMSDYPNTMVETPLFGTQITFVTTCKRNIKERGRPKRVFASYCPFCGQKYMGDAAIFGERMPCS